MRLSVNVTNYSWTNAATAFGDHLADVVRAADEAGIDTVWVADHLLQADPSSSIEAEMLEAYTTLGYLAALTHQVRLGTMVTAATYRAPALLIKAVTTLDVLSKGRAWLGIGAGYQQAEARAMGLDLPPVAQRFARLEETLRLARHMWADNPAPFRSEHYQLDQPINHPPAAQHPHPPILIGGSGERHTLRLVAEYADACNLFDIPDDGATIARKLDVLRRHCDALGRDYAGIDKTVSTRWDNDDSAGDVYQRCQQLAALGITHAVLIRPQPWTPAAIHQLAAIQPAVHEL